MKKFKLIKVQLPIFMIVLLIIPLLLVGYISYQKTAIIEKAVIQKEDMEEMSKESKKIFASYENILTQISETPEMQIDTYNVKTGDPEAFKNMPLVNDPVKTDFYQSYLRDLSSNYEYLINLYVGSETGAFYLDNIPPKEVDLTKFDARQSEWYVKAIEEKGKVIWTKPYIDTGTGKSIITLAKTITNSNGDVIGVAGMDFEMSKLATLLRNDILKTTIITGAISIIVGFVIVFFFVKRLIGNVNTIANGMKKIAEGNLTGEPVSTKGEDELSDLAHSVNLMKGNLFTIVEQVAEASVLVRDQSEELTQFANEVKEGSHQIASTMQDLSSGAETQANSTTNLAELMDQFSSKVQQAYANGDELAYTSKGILSMTNEGSKLMKNSISQMQTIDQIVRDSMEKVKGLDAQSREISTLVSVIKDIANQTNLLALNAAIEAARAGEHGKGFAVVANEVRKLAEQVNHSVEDITNIVGGIQNESNGVALSLADGFKAVDEGSKQILITGETFEKINQSVTDMAAKIQSISGNLKGISVNSLEMSTSIDEIASVSEQSAAALEEVVASAEQSSASMSEVTNSANKLVTLAEQLNEQVIRFKL